MPNVDIRSDVAIVYRVRKHKNPFHEWNCMRYLSKVFFRVINQL